MSLCNFLMIIPRCPEHDINLKWKKFSIKTSDGENYLDTRWYCEGCDAYATFDGMEKDPKQVALRIIQNFKKSYELADIVNVEVK